MFSAVVDFILRQHNALLRSVELITFQIPDMIYLEFTDHVARRQLECRDVIIACRGTQHSAGSLEPVSSAVTITYQMGLTSIPDRRACQLELPVYKGEETAAGPSVLQL